MKAETGSQARSSLQEPQADSAGPGGRGPDHPSTPGLAAILPKSPHYTATPRNSSARDARHPPSGRAQTGPPPGAQDTSALSGGDQESLSAPTPTPASPSGGPRWSRYPSRPARGSNRRLRPRKTADEPDASTPGANLLPPRLPLSTSGRLHVATSSGREEILRQRASSHRPSPGSLPAP